MGKIGPNKPSGFFSLNMFVIFVFNYCTPICGNILLREYLPLFLTADRQTAPNACLNTSTDLISDLGIGRSSYYNALSGLKSSSDTESAMPCVFLGNILTKNVL